MKSTLETHTVRWCGSPQDLQPALHLRKAEGVWRVEMGCASSHWTAVLVLLSLAHCMKT